MVWPELPEGYFAAADHREFDEELVEEVGTTLEETYFKIEIDGVEVVYEVEDDYPVIVKTQDDINAPDFTGTYGCCFICKKEFEVPDAVHHLHDEHEIEVYIG